ncbi:PIG-L deacetylase family protein [Erythrobacter litoralis]|uniref:PIG-L deacetylase family protein n=1 Tax=Erythrobacter litoralis TaxID=39960 RepID=UPI002435BC16|nr:PIG-L family deacetylase [Erythrobacter litoralis]
MNRILAISPHLDDAAFSAGGYLASRERAGDEVTILTCFTGNVEQPEGFALACQLDKGLGPDVDYMALRRAEDEAACAVIGAKPIHLPFLEAPHRGYDSAPALFAGSHEDDDIVERLRTAIAEQVEELQPDAVLGPLCIGDHVDHHAVREAMVDLPGVLLWEDWPYLDRSEYTPSSPPAFVHELSDYDRIQRLAMCRCFASQLGFQFGGEDALAKRTAAISSERFYAPSP